MQHYEKCKEYIPHIRNIVNGRNSFNEVSDIITFDIETTSIWDVNGNVTAYKDAYAESDLNDAPHKAFVWMWQLGINDTVYYGRTIEEFIAFLTSCVMKNIANAHTIIWVHNLSFEFNFLREHLERIAPIKMFARTKRQPIKFEWQGVEFRCTYMLTRKSLATWGKELMVFKKVGAIEYNKLRTPLSPIEKNELEYGEMDCLIVYNGIKQFVDEYGSQKNIPLTQTGRVRRVVKQKATAIKGYTKRITALQPCNADEYRLLKACFSGGSTGSNYINADKVCINVGSKDIASDYPYQMVSEKFPMTKFHRIGVDKPLDFEKFAYIFVIKITNLKSTQCNHYLPSSKCLSLKKATLDNGKVVRADSLIYICTEQDYLILRDCYTFDEVIIELWQSKKEYLPSFFVGYILELYEKKTILKGVDEKADEYKRSKEFINSLYGMCVMDIVQNGIEYNNGWCEKDVNVQDALNELHEKTYKNFVAYQWGVWVTAYARRLLWRVILEMGEDHVYHDTDSSKDLHQELHEDFFKKINEENIKKAKKAMKHHGFAEDRVAPKDVRGVAHPIGIFETEKSYAKFKTLGAKKYCYTYDNKKIECTISGVPKTNAIALKSIDDFSEGFTFPRTLTDPNTGACIAKHYVAYVDTDWCPTLPDGYMPTNKHSTVIRPTTYKLGLTASYRSLIDLGKQKNRLR